jgi:hypothetical protein
MNKLALWRRRQIHLRRLNGMRLDKRLKRLDFAL